MRIVVDPRDLDIAQTAVCLMDLGGSIKAIPRDACIGQNFLSISINEVGTFFSDVVPAFTGSSRRHVLLELLDNSGFTNA